MNHKRKALAFAVASCLTAGAMAQTGFAGEQGPYVGIGYQNVTADVLDVTLDNATITGGWQLSPNLSLEASYSQTFSKDGNPAIGVDNVRVRHGWVASAIGSVPLTDNISAYGRIGWGWHRLSANFGDGNEKDWIDDAVFGAGIRANLSPMAELRAEWTRLFDSSDINANGISFSYVLHLR